MATNKQNFDSIYASERIKYDSLILKETPLTTTGVLSFTSISSSLPYSSSTGEVGLLGALDAVLNPYMPTADEFNGKLDISDYNDMTIPMQEQLDYIESQTMANSNDIAGLLLQSEIDGKMVVSNSNKFYVNADSLVNPFQSSIGKIDATKGFCGTVSTGTNTVTINQMILGKVKDFKVGQEITLQDASHSEVLTILTVSFNSLVFTGNIVNTYSNGANIYRSNVSIIDGNLSIGTFTSPTLMNCSLTTAITGTTSSYSIAGNNGRKMTVLSNGWIINIALYSGTLHVYRSLPNNLTRTQICTISGVLSGASISSLGTNCMILFNSSTTLYSVSFDATTVTNTDINSTKTTIDTQTSINNNVSITNDGVSFYAVASTKNITYPNSSNLKIYQSNVLGQTWVSTQITTNNVTTINILNPCIVINALGYPVIICQYVGGGSRSIYSYYYNGSTWGYTSIYTDATYTPINPTATKSPDGYIHCAFQTKDSTDANYYNITYCRSIANGTSWDTTAKLTPSGISKNQIVPSITTDYNNNVYLLFQGGDSGSYDQIIEMIFNGTTWGNRNVLASNSSSSVSNPSTCENYRYFIEPLVLWQNSGIKFYGIYTALVDNDLLASTLRLNIAPTANVTNIASYTYSNTLLTVAGFVSNIASGSESYASTTDTTSIANGVLQTQSLKTTTANKIIALKLNLSRASVSNDIRISKIIGGCS